MTMSYILEERHPEMYYSVGKRYVWYCWCLLVLFGFIGTEVHAQSYFIDNDQRLETDLHSLKHAMVNVSGNSFAVVSFNRRPDEDDTIAPYRAGIRGYTITDSDITPGGAGHNFYRLANVISRNINESDIPIQFAVARISDDLVAVAGYSGSDALDVAASRIASFISIYSTTNGMINMEPIHIFPHYINPRNSFTRSYDHSLIKFDDDTLVLAYAGGDHLGGVTNNDHEGIIKTFSFTTTPSVSVMDGASLEYSDRQGRYSSLVKFNDDIVALAYRYPRGGGRLATFGIASDNSITEIHTLTHNDRNTPAGHRAWYNSLVKLSTNTLALAYSGEDDGKGYLKIFDVSSTGTITEMHNLIHVDADQEISHNSLVRIDENTLALAYRGGMNKAGYIKMFDLEMSTIVEVGFFKHDEQMGSYNSLIKVDDNTLALAYGGEITEPLLR